MLPSTTYVILNSGTPFFGPDRVLRDAPMNSIAWSQTNRRSGPARKSQSL